MSHPDISMVTVAFTRQALNMSCAKVSSFFALFSLVNGKSDVIVALFRRSYSSWRFLCMHRLFSLHRCKFIQLFIFPRAIDHEPLNTLAVQSISAWLKKMSGACIFNLYYVLCAVVLPSW